MGTYQAPEVIREFPPEALIGDCEALLVDVYTTEDIITNYIKLQGALYVCNADKKALRTWQRITNEDKEL